jgi:XTP/dITP diphosphohydrolase
MRILVATANAGKMREFMHLLAPLQIALCFPPDLDLALEIVEDGKTYFENARKKALSYARASNLLTLADDSGLEVDALDGAPGVRSARYATGRDADRVELLLSHLADVPRERRTARFRCVLVVTTPEGEVHTTEGVCEGLIAFAPAGQGGFGYDPIFFLPEYDCTMAQLSQVEKNRISHRARAIEAMIPTLRRLVSV